MMQIAHPDSRVTRLNVTGVLFDSHTNKAIKLGKGSTDLIMDQQGENTNKNQLKERVRIERVYLFNEEDAEVGWVSFKYLKAED